MRTALIAAALMATSATGQTVADVASQIDGVEVVETGLLRMGHGFQHLMLTDGFHDVTFALDRETLRSLDPCRANTASAMPCTVTVRAEIAVDGGQIRLIVFEITDLVIDD